MKDSIETWTVIVMILACGFFCGYFTYYETRENCICGKDVTIVPGVIFLDEKAYVDSKDCK